MHDRHCGGGRGWCCSFAVVKVGLDMSGEGVGLTMAPLLFILNWDEATLNTSYGSFHYGHVIFIDLKVTVVG